MSLTIQQPHNAVNGYSAENTMNQTELRDQKLLEKYQHYVNGSRAEQFTKEDIQRLKALENKPWSEFQSKVLQLNAETGELQELRDEQREALREANEAVTDAALDQQDNGSVEEAQQHIQKILDNNKLVDEDVKGIRIDVNF